MSLSNKKRLEGVKLTDELQSLVTKCIEYIDNGIVEKLAAVEVVATDGLTKDQATNMLQEFDSLLTPQKKASRSGEEQEQEETFKKTNLQDAIEIVQEFQTEKDNNKTTF